MSTVVTPERVVLPEKIQRWIEEFYDAKGWQTLKDTRDDRESGKSARKVLDKRVAKLQLESNTAQDELLDMQGQLNTLKKKLKSKKLSEDERTQLQGQLEKLEETEAEKLEKIDALARSLQDSQSVAGKVKQQHQDLSTQLLTAKAELEQLQQEVAGLKQNRGGDSTSLKQSDGAINKLSVEEFRKHHTDVSQRVEFARTQVAPKRFDDEPDVFLLNDREYRLLMAGLQAALLMVQAAALTGDEDRFAEAQQRVFEVDGQLKQYKLARMGINLAPLAPIDDDQSNQDYEDAKTRLACERLRKEIVSAIDAVEAGRRSEGGETQQAADRYRKALAKIDKAEKTAVLEATLSELEKLLTRVQGRLDSLRDESVHVEKLLDSHKELSAIHESLVRTDDEGETTLKKDKRTGQNTFSRTDKRIPKEAIEELGLQLQSLELLAKGDSLPAARASRELLDETRALAEDIQANPEKYEECQKRLEEARKRLDEWASQRGDYQVKERLRLDDQHKEIAKSSRKIGPTAALQQAEDHLAAVEAAWKDTEQCHNGRQYFKTLEKVCQQRFKKLGKIMKENSQLVQKSEYHGMYVDLLREAQKKADSYELDQVVEAVIAARDIGRWSLEVIEAFANENPDEKTTKLRANVIEDGEEAQQAHAENMQAKDDYDALRKQPLTTSKSTFRENCQKWQERAQAMGLDDTVFSTLIADYESVKGAVHTDEDYAKALKKMTELAGRLKARIKEAQEFEVVYDKQLGEIAADLEQQVSGFQSYLKTFFKDFIEPGNDQELTDAKIDVKKVKAAVQEAGKTLDVQPLAASITALNNETLTLLERKKHREDCLRLIREQKGILTSHPAALHLRTQTFDPENRVGLLFKAFERAEIKVLTSMKDAK